MSVPFKNLYLIKYRVTGSDHDGYCSGAEQIGDDPDFEHYKYVWTINKNLSDDDIDINKFVINKDIFNNNNTGCTSDGSGYCVGYYQQYTTIWARLYENIEFGRIANLLDERCFNTNNSFKIIKIINEYNDGDEIKIKLKLFEVKYMKTLLKDLKLLQNNFIEETEKFK